MENVRQEKENRLAQLEEQMNKVLGEIAELDKENSPEREEENQDEDVEYAGKSKKRRLDSACKWTTESEL